MISQSCRRRSFARFVPLLLGAAALALASCVNTGRPNLPAGSEKLPMHLTGNLPFVNVEMPGQRYQFLLDTGASDCVVTPEIVRRYGLPVSKEKVSVRSASGDYTGIPVTVVPEIRLGDVLYTNVPALVYDCSKFRRTVERMDGVIGFGLFEKQLLTLDYPRRQVIISPWAQLKDADPGVVPMGIVHGVPQVPLSSARKSVMIDVDSGSTSGLEINPASLGVGTKAPPRSGHMSMSISRSYRNDVARIDGTLLLGKVPMDSPVVEVTRGDQRVGGEVLTNLLLTFDQRSRRMVVSFGRLEGVGMFKIARRLTSTSRAGTGVGFDRQWTVSDVLPQSPAAAAGVKTGDKCVTINHQPVEKWSGSYSELLTPGEEIHYQMLRGGRMYEVILPVVQLVE
jgi:hypothetical protein